MRLARIGAAGAEVPVASNDAGESWWDISTLIDDIEGEFLAGGGERVSAAIDSGSVRRVTPGRFGPPITAVGKVVCIGLNYRDHARETGTAAPDQPIVFIKTPDTIVGPNDDVLIPRGSVKTDYEVELAVVIGRPARYLGSPEAASAVIAGYAVSNDVSEREFQLERGGQWAKGKNCETFNPLGPWIATPDEIDDPRDLSLRLWVNGEARQDGNTREMIFDVSYLIWYVSQYMVLRPGDIVNTGTPAGVVLGRPNAAYLQAGDIVELEIDGLGRQRQTLKQA